MALASTITPHTHAQKASIAKNVHMLIASYLLVFILQFET